MEIEIRTYRHEDWPLIQSFIHEHWRAGHPYTDRTLYDWQFAGFGSGGRLVSRLAVRGDEVLGLLGGIPGDYFLEGQVLSGVVFDLWVVRPDVRNGALGLMLMRSLEDDYEVTCCLGVNLNVVRFYTARGYQHAPCLRRYVVPLEVDGVQRLLSAAGELSREDSQTLAASREMALAGATHVAEPSADLDATAAQLLYERTVEKAFHYGAHRSSEFWDWRYLRSAGFRYLFFGDPWDAGLIVARVEQAISPELPALDGMPVLRLIELLPGSVEAWTGGTDLRFTELLRGVLAWAAERGCVLADFQHSSDRIGPLLEAAGFTDISRGGTPLAMTPNLFQPLRLNASPINFVWRMNGRPAPDVRDTYFVKSDDGMDRPNVWPLQPAYAGVEGSRC